MKKLNLSIFNFMMFSFFLGSLAFSVSAHAGLGMPRPTEGRDFETTDCGSEACRKNVSNHVSGTPFGDSRKDAQKRELEVFGNDGKGKSDDSKGTD